MSQQGSRVSDSVVSGKNEGDSPLGELEVVRLSAARARAIDETSATIARQLNGPLTALLLYMGEIKHHSHQFVRSAGDRDYLQKVVDNALAQERRPRPLKEAGGAPGVMATPELRQRPLTKREREVLQLISQGYSNKQGALRMQISPRTFESHRAEAMRKLGARNTADLVRAALLHPID
jgi:DNA-binding NarL/FixJ family response regulator